jgi:hypothetical protein
LGVFHATDIPRTRRRLKVRARRGGRRSHTARCGG